MGFIGVSDSKELYEIRKQINAMLRKTQSASKPDRCILCGEQKTSYCNSHSVPRMMLKNIAEKGKVLQANALVDIELIDTEKGLNNSGTFHFICNECDKRYFRDYEDPKKLLIKPDDKILAEIALKNSLVQLSKRKQEVEIYKEAGKNPNVRGLEVIEKILDLDIKEYTEEIELYKSIIDNNTQNCFQILYWTLLPYVTPIAAQSGIALTKDLEGNIVNDIGDLSESLRIQNMHIGIFPLDNTTAVMAFYHRRDKRYRKLRHQLNVISDEEKLKYINWLVMKYTENYFISKSIHEVIDNDTSIQELSRENNGQPNLGMVDLLTLMTGYKSVGVNDITNLLAPVYAVR